MSSHQQIPVLESIVLEILKLIITKERDISITNDAIKCAIKNYYLLEKYSMKKNTRKFNTRWHPLDQLFAN